MAEKLNEAEKHELSAGLCELSDRLDITLKGIRDFISSYMLDEE